MTSRATPAPPPPPPALDVEGRRYDVSWTRLRWSVRGAAKPVPSEKSPFVGLVEEGDVREGKFGDGFDRRRLKALRVADAPPPPGWSQRDSSAEPSILVRARPIHIKDLDRLWDADDGAELRRCAREILVTHDYPAFAGSEITWRWHLEELWWADWPEEECSLQRASYLAAEKMIAFEDPRARDRLTVKATGKQAPPMRSPLAWAMRAWDLLNPAIEGVLTFSSEWEFGFRLGAFLAEDRLRDRHDFRARIGERVGQTHSRAAQSPKARGAKKAADAKLWKASARPWAEEYVRERTANCKPVTALAVVGYLQDNWDQIFPPGPGRRRPRRRKESALFAAIDEWRAQGFEGLPPKRPRRSGD